MDDVPADQNSWGVFAVDPGVTTGVAFGLFDCGQPTVASCIRRAKRKGLLKTHELTGDWNYQAWKLARWYFDWLFANTVERGIVIAGQCVYVTEKFDIRTLAADITPLRINDGVEILLCGGFGVTDAEFPDTHEFDKHFSEQTPSEKSFCSNDMLKDWGLWLGKSVHERDAIRHLAKRIDRILEGK